MEPGWESCVGSDKRAWHLQAALEHRWAKAALLE